MTKPAQDPHALPDVTLDRIIEAIEREKALKKWRRNWKIRLIEEMNPDWSDLYGTLAGWTG